jgi:hypothetical protein
MHVAHIVRDIEKVTRHVLQRRGPRRAPTDIRAAAHIVRAQVDVDALLKVLDYLATCPYAPPVRVGAAVWRLGGNTEHFIRCHRTAIQRQLAA